MLTKSRWAFGIIAAGSVFLLVAISILDDGPGLSPDSAEYIAGARSLAAGDGYIGLTGNPMDSFPPGFSAVLAIGILLGFEGETVAGWVNALLAAGAVLITALVIDRVVNAPWVKWLALVPIVFSVPILTVSTTALSEPLFILLTMATLAMLERSSTSAFLLATAGLFAGLAAMTRYIGVTVTIAGVIWIWLKHEHRLTRSLWYAIPPGVLVFGLALRNYLVTESWTRGLSDPANSLLTNLKFLIATAGRWFVPSFIPLALGTLIVGALAGYLAWRVVVTQFWQSTGSTVGLFATFAAVYISTLLALELMVNIDPPTIRFLSPIYLPLVIVAASLLDTSLRRERSRAHRTATIVASSLLVVGAALAAGTLVLTKITGSYWWNDSEMVTHARANSAIWEDQYHLRFSNDPWVTYLQADLVVELIATKTKRLSTEPGTPPDAMCPNETSQSLLIWYELGVRPHHYTLNEIENVCRLVPVVELDDGTAYVITGLAGQ